MMGNPVGWFEIYVSDIQRGVAFYQALFDVELFELNPGADGGPVMWAFPWQDNAPGAPGAICQMEGVSPGGNSTIVYFGCDDCQIQQDRVAGAGGQVLRPKMSIGEYGFITIAADPDGNMIGLHSMK
ncbi:Glyoxalase/bleomycin resistance protein/dioxygenase [Ferrimonas balearica DSM 9799]|uniref:Glyoxalase/bleomycin resistance protein/dioxygenase n=2 Tax=Ferrimonas balearica TaxID=44012 RepID=E1SRL0_FERBD|nr:VOC family protein [Ferrimonas balearica]ADN76931.1 Glyoxalase/bleomycin resistance protein/dioxygenase [Ferrimonas balearica DSM 9799]MBY6093691.1 VOC family protein [Ferrimonas balearica]